MSMTRCAIYHGQEPNFPATDQHPDARRYYVYADGHITAAPVQAAPDAEIPRSSDNRLSEEDRVILAAQEGQRARAEKDRRAQEWVGAKPVYVVDAIGEPTLDEIEKVLGG